MAKLVKNLDLLADYQVIKVPPKKASVKVKPIKNKGVRKGGTVLRNPYDTD